MGIYKLQRSQPPLYVDYTKETTSKTDKVTVVKEEQNSLHLVRNDDEQNHKEDVQKLVTSLNDFIKPTRTNLQYEFHDELEKYYVTIVNAETKEVMKEIPEKKFLDMYAKMAEYMGLLIDEKV